jgi:hypothetical protein
MSEDKTKKALINYVNTASDLADSVKNDIVHDGVVTDETVIKLNKFIIASNAIQDLYEELSKDPKEENENLN